MARHDDSVISQNLGLSLEGLAGFSPRAGEALAEPERVEGLSPARVKPRARPGNGTDGRVTQTRLADTNSKNY